MSTKDLMAFMSQNRAPVEPETIQRSSGVDTTPPVERRVVTPGQSARMTVDEKTVRPGPIAISEKNKLPAPDMPSLINPTVRTTAMTGVPDRPVSLLANSNQNPAMDTPECRMAVKNERTNEETLLKRRVISLI